MNELMAGFSTNYTNTVLGVEDNDLYIDDDGNLAVSNGDNAIIEAVYHAVNLYLGEYDFSTDLGVDWQYYLSTDSPAGIQIKTDVQNAILSVNGVSSIQQITLTTTGRALNIQSVIILDSGTIENVGVNFNGIS